MDIFKTLLETRRENLSNTSRKGENSSVPRREENIDVRTLGMGLTPTELSLNHPVCESRNKLADNS